MEDLEICKRIAEIEGLDFEEIEPLFPNKKTHIAIKNKGGLPITYNPLINKSICFNLMVKYELDLIAPFRPNGETKWEVGYWVDGVSDAGHVYDENPQRAICLAIIAKHS